MTLSHLCDTRSITSLFSSLNNVLEQKARADRIFLYLVGREEGGHVEKFAAAAVA